MTPAGAQLELTCTEYAPASGRPAASRTPSSIIRPAQERGEFPPAEHLEATPSELAKFRETRLCVGGGTRNPVATLWVRSLVDVRSLEARVRRTCCPICVSSTVRSRCVR